MVAAAILISKLAGLLRQRVTAHFFGTSAIADVIAAAFRIGNLCQNLLGEGTLSASFIPIYAKLRQEGRDDEADAFARDALGLLGALVIVVSAIGVALAPWLAIAVAGGFAPDKLAMTTRLVRLLFPMTGVLVLCAWALGVLNAHRQFFAPYVAPVIWSAGQIAALLVGGSWLLQSGETLARTLAYGAIVGAVLELGVLLLRARRHLRRLLPSFDRHNPHVREAASRLPGVLLGRGVIQISGLVDTLLVSFLGTGANATFAYAQMLYLLPMSLLGTGEAAVSLPEMARDTAIASRDERNARMRRRLAVTTTRVLVFAVPAMVVLMLFGDALINVLLRTGRFDAESTQRVAAAVRIYAFALVANASVRLYATTFFAIGDTRIPARFAVVRVIVSTLLALALLKPFGVLGVVGGAVIAGWVEAVALGIVLRRQLDGLGLDEVPWPKLGGLALITAAIPLLLESLLPPRVAQTFLGSFGLLGATGLVFLGAAVGLGLLNLRRFLRR
ncbi:MAG: murein biosynthesis integral membrane protein MurJ [Myxococcales bacterium]|nr:murein biosynthesis integral membrane protein MurJ [Myxococcales bacterium]